MSVLKEEGLFSAHDFRGLVHGQVGARQKHHSGGSCSLLHGSRSREAREICAEGKELGRRVHLQSALPHPGPAPHPALP